MNQPFMSIPNHSKHSFAWQLPARGALTLTADAAPRALWVHEGRVWLTRQCATGTPDDVWLDAGHSHTLPAGSEWVVEASPTAWVLLLQAAPSRTAPRKGAYWARAWQAAVRAVQAVREGREGRTRARGPARRLAPAGPGNG